MNDREKLGQIRVIIEDLIDSLLFTDSELRECKYLLALSDVYSIVKEVDK